MVLQPNCPYHHLTCLWWAGECCNLNKEVSLFAMFVSHLNASSLIASWLNSRDFNDISIIYNRPNAQPMTSLTRKTTVTNNTCRCILLLTLLCKWMIQLGWIRIHWIERSKIQMCNRDVDSMAEFNPELILDRIKQALTCLVKWSEYVIRSSRHRLLNDGWNHLVATMGKKKISFKGS